MLYSKSTYTPGWGGGNVEKCKPLRVNKQNILNAFLLGDNVTKR